MFDGLVLCIERKKLQPGKPTGELLGDNILFEKMQRIYNPGNLHGNTG